MDLDPDTQFMEPATVASCMRALTMARNRTDLTVVEKLALAETTVDTAYYKGAWNDFFRCCNSRFTREERMAGRLNTLFLKSHNLKSTICIYHI